MSSKPKKHPCPQCDSMDWIPIAYGYPSEKLLETSSRGEVAIGGCCIEDDSPNWECKKCGHQIYKE